MEKSQKWKEKSKKQKRAHSVVRVKTEHMEKHKCDTHTIWNRYIEFFDFHFSRVLCSTEMEDLRLLGIRRIGLFLRLHFHITRWWNGFILFFLFWWLFRGAMHLKPFWQDAQSEMQVKKINVYSFCIICNLLANEKIFHSVSYNGNILYGSHSFTRLSYFDFEPHL